MFLRSFPKLSKTELWALDKACKSSKFMYDMGIPTEKKGKYGGRSMVVKALARSWDILGLQFLFARVRSCAGTDLRDGKPLKERDKESFENLKKFLKAVIKGIEDEQGKYKHLRTLKEGVEAERAFESIRPVLPEDLTSAKKKLRGILKIRDNILRYGHCPDIEREKLIAFCRTILNHLDEKRLRLKG